MDVRIYNDIISLSQAAANAIYNIAVTAIAEHGKFNIALSGGSTPKSLFKVLATRYQQEFSWEQTQIFWSDERCVPPESPDSNYYLAKTTLFDHIAIPPSNIYRVKGEIEPQAAAAEYEEILKQALSALPRFDVILLGMGDDGHTASLFPGTTALKVHDRLVIENFVPTKDMWRITFTDVTINAAANIMFLISGRDKTDRLQQVLEGQYQPDTLPAQLVKPKNGNLIWFIDESAAAKLHSNRK